ncbi:hypothetical protein BBO99_00003093 [Phytophthora kernoviae]|uniref:Uncharacterized protein n=2 Tax=Phytophthora kernoviae TaxID=325452 RepID=A0A3R7G7E6_9STRA|nr:hypothetical protein G195_003228 [Phytophthora kernoviae 00238/432]KAG2528947.1 hypothetical protein JM16_000937 [Phytophthora kernoviae]KAG2530252.1 hypothetical protein JM18_001018 [Phytophthora kernoviae]RLN44212.1 hypothetical protein BBI17_002958 [Phytophthora kernoviae]RLN82165.1 hypothetical protein BBO99_00003093 [Phytophthora kernoviae]
MRMLRIRNFWTVVAFGIAITSSTATSSRVTNSSMVQHEISTIDNSMGSVTVGSADGDVELTVRHILHFSDVHLNLSESLNASDSAKIPFAYGDDAPLNLLVSALDYAKELIPDPDFFLYTGDHVVHGEFSDEYLVETIKTNVEMMAKYYSTADNGTVLDITAILGNADTSPDYTMNVTDPEKGVNPTISLVSGVWEDTLPQSNLKWFNRRGYLSYDLDDNLMVITLNTLPYSPSHHPDTSHLPDPFKQFEWLNATLLELRNSSKFAYIAGHIPPIIDSYSGSPQWNETYIKTYKQIVSQYADVIKAQFFGHIHSIEFRLPISVSQAALIKQNGEEDNEDYGDSSQLVPLFMVAAISPIFENNPAFMIWDFDANSYDILDFTVYGSNISNTSQELNWQPLFKASTEYGVNSLNTSQISGFVKHATVNAELLEQYYYNSKAQSRLQESCLDTTCQAQWLCSISLGVSLEIHTSPV